LAVLASYAAGGGDIQLPPWYANEEEDRIMSDDSLIGMMNKFGRKREV
jgi:hypothetical protein